jgi:hypothetical protein
MPDDPLSTDPPVRPPTPPDGPRVTICQACGCELARNGEILSTGEKYKKFLKHEQTLDEKDREISKLQSELAESKRELDALKQSSGGTRQGYRPGSRIS